MVILWAILIVAAIGIIAGLGLAIASIVMAVPTDEKAEAILEILPGANCGACGFSGCSGYAAALAKGKAEPNLCAPGGIAVMQEIAALTGNTNVTMEVKTAMVMCQGSCDNTEDRMEYDGISTCTAAAMTAGGSSACTFGCLGLGDCVRACEYDAIAVVNGVARVTPSNCTACTMCVRECPRNLIRLVPVKKQAVVRCINADKGAVANKICKVSCIACSKCVKVCEFDAIHVSDFHATVDPAKCTNCGKCIEACPKNCLTTFS